MTDPRPASGLSLAPFRATRFTADAGSLGQLLSPPYDVISDADRAGLVAAGPTNVVRLILPEQDEAQFGGGDRYAGARALLEEWVSRGVLAVDGEPALFVYEMSTPDGAVTRGLLGAVELRDPEDGVILPHENTMAGPVSDRLALMTATEANLEPIFLVYDGGGPASELVASVGEQQPISSATTPDGVRHRLWAVTDPAAHAAVADDLAGRRALIADGHHRYATYRQLQADHSGEPGPWDRGLTLLVDTSSYGPQVHPIHRVVALPWNRILELTEAAAEVGEPVSVAAAEKLLAQTEGFAVALAHEDEAVIVSNLSPDILREALGPAAGTPLGELDITVLHRVLVERVWQLSDNEDNVGYAHSVSEALAEALHAGRTAVLVRPTPVAAVAAVAAAGERMPRKSTLFTPKPASGMVIRRFADQ
ncbi:DUF1015 family protein [Jatrophihabitans sp.]|uniref:DUF1015 family protein n=1 Tax=Jatrophihabitans sp. TaxID=1932789 RepID=UPI002C0E8AFE|nr:DUF1015 domain-containing protein [Jatrophihabitans sp.]